MLKRKGRPVNYENSSFIIFCFIYNLNFILKKYQSIYGHGLKKSNYTKYKMKDKNPPPPPGFMLPFLRGNR
jgi:hypothetical protein